MRADWPEVLMAFVAGCLAMGFAGLLLWRLNEKARRYASSLPPDDDDPFAVRGDSGGRDKGV